MMYYSINFMSTTQNIESVVFDPQTILIMVSGIDIGMFSKQFVLLHFQCHFHYCKLHMVFDSLTYSINPLPFR